MKPHRSRKYLDLAEGQSCIRCGAHDGTVVSAHYCGRYQHRLGRGAGQKAHDFCSAHLCGRCHTEFDTYAAGNDDARAAEFMLLILETLARNIRRGVLVVAA